MKTLYRFFAIYARRLWRRKPIRFSWVCFRYWYLRINWRVCFALLFYNLSPYVGLEDASVKIVRDASITVIVAAFLAWANQQGQRRKYSEKDHGSGSGLLGVRPEDVK